MATPDNTMTLDTTKGKVVIEMRPDLAPGHVARIKELVKSGFYDGIVFHRVIDGFMAQTGCPHGTGTGGSGQKLKAEFNKEPHVRGTVSMARAQNRSVGMGVFYTWHFAAMAILPSLAGSARDLATSAAAPISSTSSFRPSGSRCGLCRRAMRRGCSSCGRAVCRSLTTRSLKIWACATCRTCSIPGTR